MFCADSVGHIQIWSIESATQAPLLGLYAGESDIDCISVAGDWLVAAVEEWSTIAVYRRHTYGHERCLRGIASRARKIRDTELSLDSRFLACAVRDYVYLYGVGETTRVFDIEPRVIHEDVWSLAFSRDTPVTVLAAALPDQSVALYSVRDLSLVRRVPALGDNRLVYALAMTSASDIVVGDTDGTVTLIDSDRRAMPTRALGGLVRSIAVTRDAERLISCSADGSVRCFRDTRSSRAVARFYSASLAVFTVFRGTKAGALVLQRVAQCMVDGALLRRLSAPQRHCVFTAAFVRQTMRDARRNEAPTSFFERMRWLSTLNYAFADLHTLG